MSKNEEMYSSWQGDLDSQSEKVKIGQKVEEISLNQLKGFKNHPFKVETNTYLFELMQSIERETLRLMPDEAKMLAEKSELAGMCEADYLRLLISQKPNDYPELRRLLRDLINEINRIGININQLVYNHNAGFYSKQDKEHLFAYMKKLNVTVKEAVVQIGNQ